MKKLNSVLKCQLYMIRRMADTSKRLFVSTLIKSILSGVIPTVELVLSRNLIAALLEQNLNGTAFYIIAIGITSLLYWGITHILDFVAGDSYTLIKQKMWFELFEKTSTLDLAIMDLQENKTLYEEARGATANNRCTRVLDSFFGVLTHIIALASTMAIMLTVDVWVIIVITVVIVVQTVLIIKKQQQQYETWKEDAKTNKEVSYLMGLLFDRNCANEFRLHNLSNWVITKYRKAREKTDNLWRQNNKKQTHLSVFSYVGNLIQEVFVYIYLAIKVLFENMSIADFTLCFQSINRLSSELIALIKVVIDIGEDTRYIESFKKYLELKNVIAIHSPEDKTLSQSEVLLRPLVFCNVSFKYPQSKDYVLKDINITLDPREFYVIVGVNGSGKTTFVNLIMRLYDPCEGHIRLGADDIKNFDYQDYRNCFGAVFQNYRTFDYSLLENITLSADKDNATVHNAYLALKKAGLEEKLKSFENGVDTYIGRAFVEDGVQLSGGEYQKVALARALYRDPAILVLDEPSSALDAFAEDDLITTFKKASRSKTVFYISHRLSAAQYAYKVIFIDNNGIAGFDTHEKLLKDCPKYREMYTAQVKHYMDEKTILD